MLTDLYISHLTLQIVLRREGRDGRLEVACIDPLFIHGPVQWLHPHIGVVWHGEDGFVVTDTAADVRIITGKVEVTEYV